MIIASCPLRISLFGGSTDNPYFVAKYGYGSVISFASNLKTYVTISRDKFGFNKKDHKYVINYSRREEVNHISEIKNEVVRGVLEHFDMPPVQVTLTSDAFSQGSGLASSSSYIISLIKACSLFLHKKISDTDICRLAYDIEVKFNPFCGYQDPYGCGIGGFKRIEFLDTGSVKHEFLSTDVFDGIDIKLVFTGVTRNSKEVLRDVSMNLEKVKPLLPIVSTAYDYLKQGDGKKFLKELNHTWEEKKKTSNIITENEMIRKIDKELSDNSSVISHKLCGAGNGGFFLTFSKHNKLTIPYDTVKIKVNYEGVRGESV